MINKYVKIISFGLIGESEDGSNYRPVTFEDLGSGRKANYLVNQKQRPILWSDIEILEKGKVLPPYQGYITNFMGIEIVVLGDESLEDAYENQKWKLENHKKLSLSEADSMRQLSKGYITNHTFKNAMEYSWHGFKNEINQIKFRYYSGRGNYSWSPWYEIDNV
jgi:hypothetical protein